MLAEAIVCLALNVYYEARSQSVVEQIAVAQVVINRVNDDRYPNTVCKVVKQGEKNHDGSMKKDRCQFSWYCDGATDKPYNKESWELALSVAKSVYEGKTTDLTEGATHYHAISVNPFWAKTLKRVTRIGKHIYYRWEKI